MNQLLSKLLNKLLKKEDLSREEAASMIHWIMSESAVPVQAAALLALLQAKGHCSAEIAGAAEAMRENSLKIKSPEVVVDTCSTGGNGISTFNISTCAAIIASAEGAVVAKHGNRSNTRKSGSAEALAALGVNIDLEVPRVEACLEELNLCFCYAIHHHPSMRFAGPIRKQLGIPTIFNVLGPLTNPAGATRQIIGVPHLAWTQQLAGALQQLGSQHVLVVTAEDGLCELSTTSTTHIAELKGGVIKSYSITPESVGLKYGKLDELRIKTPEDSASMIKDILSGAEQRTPRDIAILNAAGALVVAGIADDLKEGVERAKKSVDSGSAMQKLQALVTFTGETS